MGSFEAAFDKTMGHEGGYSDNPQDRGGETYKGISRKFHPGWDGWPIVDGVKKAELSINQALSENPSFQRLVYIFYREKFWDPVRGGELPQALAEEAFDTAVNMGPGRFIKFLQEALNLLNKNATLFPDLKVDGGFGSRTMQALQVCLAYKGPARGAKTLVKWINVFQGDHYRNLMKRDPTQEAFAWGWTNRIALEV